MLTSKILLSGSWVRFVKADDDTGKHVDYPSLYFDDYRSEFIRARSFDYRCIRDYDYHYVHDGSYVSPD